MAGLSLVIVLALLILPGPSVLSSISTSVPSRISASVHGPPPNSWLPPFYLASAFSNVTVQGVGCRSELVSVVPRAHPYTGLVVTTSNVTAIRVPACPTSANNLSTVAGFFGPRFQPVVSGPHTVLFRWQVSWMVSSGGMGLGGAAQANLFADVFDNTTGVWVLGGASASGVVQLISSCSSHPMCNKTGVLQNLTVRVRANLTAGDDYVFYTGVSTFIEGCDGCGTHTGTSWASVDIGSSGRGAWLRSIAVR
ncbi:MAG: hypothetical protein L3K18_05045 [Thermoplasmata archaeon]|nr:hypothetical protein [Thermoplasmata archaeon]